jgi:hypothetical protein
MVGYFKRFRVDSTVTYGRKSRYQIMAAKEIVTTGPQVRMQLAWNKKDEPYRRKTSLNKACCKSRKIQTIASTLAQCTQAKQVHEIHLTYLLLPPRSSDDLERPENRV